MCHLFFNLSTSVITQYPCFVQDDKFERLFKLYAEKVHIKPDNLVFSFDGDKVCTNATPDSLGLEDDDIIEVHVKSQ